VAMISAEVMDAAGLSYLYPGGSTVFGDNVYCLIPVANVKCVIFISILVSP